MAEEEDYSNIKNDFSNNTETLKKQITGIELKQQELQKYISTIDNGISYLEQMIHYEENKPKPSMDKVRGLRTAITKNVELISNLYNSYKEFEMVKFRYFKEIDDNDYKMHRLIELELKKINQNTNRLGEEFYNMMRNLSQISEPDNVILEESNKILENNEYSL